MAAPILEDMQRNIIGAWANAERTVYFMFDDPDNNYFNPVMTFKLKGVLRSVPYFIGYVPLDRFKIHIKIPVYPFEYGGLMLDYISSDTIELSYYEEIYTLMRVTEDLESVFNDV